MGPGRQYSLLFLGTAGTSSLEPFSYLTQSVLCSLSAPGIFVAVPAAYAGRAGFVLLTSFIMQS